MDDSNNVVPSARARDRQPVDDSQLVPGGSRIVTPSGYEPTLASIAQLAVPALADYCCFDILENGQVGTALLHGHPAQQAILADLRAYLPGWHAREVIRTGLPLHVPGADSPEVVGHAVDGRHAELLRGLHTGSLFVVPLIVRGQILGALSLGLVGQGAQFAVADLAAAQELAAQAARALDRARRTPEVDLALPAWTADRLDGGHTAERYRAFIEQSSEAIWRLELEKPIPTGLPEAEQLDLLYRRGYVAEANEALARMHGFVDVQEALGSHLGQLLPRLAPQNLQFLATFIRGGYRISNYESKEIDRQGNVRHFANNLVGIVEDGALVRLWGVKRDITERKQAEEALRQARDELEMLLVISGEVAGQLEVGALLGAVADRLQEIVDYASLVIFRLVGEYLEVVEYRGPVSRAAVLGQRMPVASSLGLAEVVGERRPVIVPDVRAHGSPERDWTEEAQPLQRQLTGTTRSWLGVPLLVQDRIIGALRVGHPEPNHFSAHDAELALAFANHAAIALENARLYERAQQAAALEERQRLARDLHDAVSQILFSASLTADVLPTLYSRDPVQGQALLADLQQMNRGAMAEMRVLLLELRPAALLETDLGNSLRQLADAATGRSRIPVQVTIEQECALTGELQEAFYRIAQEALHNVVKHSRADGARVSLKCTPGPDGSPAYVELTVVDDGRGFDREAVPADHFGLCVMAERARKIHAALTIDTQPGAGTQVRMVWPGA